MALAPSGVGCKGSGAAHDMEALLPVKDAAGTATGDAAGRGLPLARVICIVAAASATLLGLLLLLHVNAPGADEGVEAPKDAVGLAASKEVFGGLAGLMMVPIRSIKATFGTSASEENRSLAEECRMGADERCPLSKMQPGEITVVYPGNGTRCLLSDAPDYMFQVIRGDRDKLLLYFQGGGACWDEGSVNLGVCTRAVAEVSKAGIFDPQNAANPFVGYTIVIIGYCSGDAHVGNVNRSWQVPSGAKVEQVGYRNARSAVDWAKANIGGGEDGKLASFVVTGSSAGALGTQAWAKTLLREFKYQDAAVIADSYAGVFPPGVQGQIQQESGICTTSLLDGPLLLRCNTGTLDVQSIFEDTMRAFPAVAFASLDGKIDKVQISFYEVIYASLLGRVDHDLPQKKFSQDLATIYRRYNLQPNWVSYMVNSAHHMFLPSDVLYSTRPGSTKMRTSGLVQEAVSFTGLELTGRDTPLVQWLRRFPVRAGGSVRSECRGTIQHAAPAPTSVFGQFKSLLSTALSASAEAASELSGVNYCNPGQADKVFNRVD